MTIIRPSKIRRTSSPPEASTPPYLETVFALPVGAAPLIAALCRDIGLPQIIDAEATWDRKRSILSPGDRITALVVNLLCEERRPLYKVANSFEKRDTELLFGKGITPEHLNDDCLGRGLDTLWEIDPSRIFRLVSTAVRVKECLETSFVHFDTTTRILYGQYGYETPLTANDLVAQIADTKKTESPAETEVTLSPVDSKPVPPAPSSERSPANPAYGHSKDHRNDLKQLIIAIAIDQNGLPVSGGLKSGNASDKVSNLEAIEEILAIFPEELRQSMVYIADSALVTEKNLTRLSQEKMRFVSLLPGTFGCGEMVRKKSWEEASWVELGALRPQKDAASYRASEQSGTIGEIPYRLVVYHSSALDRRKAKGIVKAAASEKASLEKAARELAKKIFFCEDDAKRAGEEFLSSHKSAWHPLSFTVETRVVKEKRTGRGRPKKDETTPETIVYGVKVTVGGADSPVLAAEIERRSCFVLITNLPKEECSARQLLSEYKGQASVEKVFSSVVKEPVVLDAFFLKNKTRLDALGHVLLLATLVYMLLQYRLRRSGIRLDRPPRGLLANPTSREILQHLDMASVVIFESGVRKIQIPPSHLNGFKQILYNTGFDEKIYIEPHRRSHGRELTSSEGSL